MNRCHRKPKGRQHGSKNRAQGEPVAWASDRQLAARYSVSRSTIWNWVKEGKLPPPDKIGGASRWRVAVADAALVQEGAA